MDVYEPSKGPTNCASKPSIYAPIVSLPTPATPDIVRPFTSTTRDLASMVRVVQGSVPLTRVATVQAKKNETFRLIQDDNDCGLIPNPTENNLEDPSAMFADCGSVDAREDAG